jgi:predicted RNA binding protein YcfA (HicA-like mRNA interferase family)
MSSGGRRLRNVRARSAMRAFRRLGYNTVRVRGSHHVLRHADGRIIVLPVHRGTLKAGILLDAIKRAGVSIGEFEEKL